MLVVDLHAGYYFIFDAEGEHNNNIGDKLAESLLFSFGLRFGVLF